jgi:RNA polymerase sigma-54 factor
MISARHRLHRGNGKGPPDPGLDPPGIAAQHPDHNSAQRQNLEDSLAYRIRPVHLLNRNYALIARQPGTVRSVLKEMEVITALTPFPGNEFSNEQVNYVVPDVYVFKVGEYVIQLNNDGLPQLKLRMSTWVSARAEREPGPGIRGVSPGKQRSAEWFIKSLQQRTIYKVMESILV